MDLNRAFGQTLRKVRLEKGLTHEVLAERANLHPTFISLLERGRRMPSLNTIFLLARGPHIRPSDLVETVERLDPRPET